MVYMDIPGFTEAELSLRMAMTGRRDEGLTVEELVELVLKAATTPILAAAFADLSDTIAEDTAWPDGQVLSVFLDAVSARIRERTGQ